MKIMLLGCPGAGKGTQAKLLCEQYNIVHISTGDILRAAIRAETDLGKLAKDCVNQGKFVADDIMMKLVKSRILEKDCKNGFLLDGVPRTYNQAKKLKEHGIILDAIVELNITDEEAVKRISGRWMHLPSGRTYHNEYNPPKQKGIDDITGEKLIQRIDDQKETILKRLSLYRSQISEIKSYYMKVTAEKRHYVKIDAIGDVKDIYNKIVKSISGLNLLKEHRLS